MVSVDPLADLVFTLVAILLLVLMVLLPGLVMTHVLPQEAPQSVREMRFDFAGRSVKPFLATASGIQQSGLPGEIPLAAVTTDPALSTRLDAMLRDGETIILLVSPDGLEAAFEFEALAGARGVTMLTRWRMTSGCGIGAARLDCKPAPEPPRP